jgi:hypothetical protein
MKTFVYKGNSAYCYPDCASMLLSTVGCDIPPSLIEVIGGVGIGAFCLPNSNIAFLSNLSGLPDQAISRALKMLGFEFIENYKKIQVILVLKSFLANATVTS